MEENSDQRIADMICRYVDLRGKHVLEVGCGDGRVTCLLADKPGKLVAVDPEVDKVREARKKISGAEFHIGSGENLAFPNACFDVVIFTLSLHHQNSDAALKEAARVLKDDGVILVIEPMNEGEVERVYALVHNENRATLKAQRAVLSSGLRVVHSESFHAKWCFEDKDELCGTVFDYYDKPFNSATAKQMIELLGAQSEEQPLVLSDTMVFQILRKQ